MGVFLNGEAIPNVNGRGERIVDDSFYILFNAHHEPITFTFPDAQWARRWNKIFATNEVTFSEEAQTISAGDRIQVEARSLMLLQKEPEEKATKQR